MLASSRKRHLVVSGAVAACLVAGGTAWFLRNDTPALPAAEPERPSATAITGERSPSADQQLGTTRAEPDVNTPSANPSIGSARSQVAVLRLSGSATGGDARVEVVSVSTRDDPVPTRRSWRVTADDLVIAVLDEAKSELFRSLTLDPRIVRGEFFGADGQIDESITVVRDAVVTVAYPHTDAARWLVVYKPSWQGSDFELLQVATVELPAADGGVTP